MKNQIRFAIAVLFITVFSLGSQAAVKGKNATLVVKTSAVCGSCKARIEKALLATDGVKEASVNLDSKNVKVKYDPKKLSENQVRLAINNVGYDADGQKADPAAYAKLPGCCQSGSKAACKHASE